VCKYLKRWSAFALALVVAVSVTLPAGAAGFVSSAVSTSMESAAVEAGYEVLGTAALADTESAGAAATFHLSGFEVNEDQSVVVAVQAVDADGNALPGHDLRYLLAGHQDGATAVTIQEPGCQYFAVLPLQGVLEQGCIASLTTTSAPGGGGYGITLSAELTMSDDLAEKVILAKGTQALKDMRITCRVESALLEGMTSVDAEQIAFTDLNRIYQVESAAVVNGGVEITCSVSDEAMAEWVYLVADDLKEELQAPMSMSCTTTISADVVHANANEDGKIYTYGQVTITNGDGTKAIPGMDAKKIVVPGKLAEVSAQTLIDLSLVKLSGVWSGERSLSVTVTNQNAIGLNGWLMCAAYDVNGRMLCCKAEYVAVAGGKIGTVSVDLPPAPGTIHSAKVMLLDASDGYTPMCIAAEVQ